MNYLETERHLMEEAVLALETQTDGQVKVLQTHHDPRERGFDAKFDLELHGQTMHFLVEVKNVDRRPALAQIKAHLEKAIDGDYQGFLPLLIAPYMTEAMAEECRRLNLPFVDTAGNLFLRTGTTLLYIIGRPRPKHIERRHYRAITPAGMKILFALLCKPEIVGLPYRRIAEAARVALGTIGPVLDDLETRRFLRRNAKAQTKLQRTDELLQEWVVQYPATLRPKLNGRRYAADRNRVLDLNLAAFNAYWGGEVAAERLTGYLQPEQILMYIRDPARDILIQGRMRLAADGNIEILDAFWNPELDRAEKPVVPPLLAYADLMMTGDTRNLETARILYEQYLQPITTAR